ncbi:MAG: hypothetical protein EXR68_00515 [Dehalococcoidia bacterium]|nr:hypothetical protein [Dehalococcoidia bacterium]
MAATGKVLISGGTVFDSLTGTMSRQDILIDGDHIEVVAPSIDAPDARRVDATGKWVTPGFIDMHVHAGAVGMETLPIFVGHGVTTVRDLGGDQARLKQMKLDVEMGKVVGPNIVYAGPLLQQFPAFTFESEERGSAPGNRPFRTDADAIEGVRRLIEEGGVGSLKLYTSIRPPIAAAILKAAEGRVPVTGHLGLTPSSFVIERGIGGLEHVAPSLIRDLAPEGSLPSLDSEKAPTPSEILQAWAKVDLAGPLVERWLKLFVEKKVALTPTMTIGPARPRPDDRRLGLLPISLASAQSGGRGGGGGPLGTEEEIAKASAGQRGIMQLIYREGGEMVVGTDLLPGGLPGAAYHIEMSAFVRRGVAAADVLKMATSVAARHLWRDDLGVIAAGKRADLVILDRDPVADIANVESISQVMRGGELHEAAKLLAVADQDVDRFFPAVPAVLKL